MVDLDELFRKVNRWVKYTRWIWPPPIEISTDHVASIVTNDDSIWIKHRHNLKDERVPQQLRFSVVLQQQELDRTMYHKRSI